MSRVSSPVSWNWQPPTLPVRRFSVEEYHRMIEAGILTTDDAVELLEGWIVPKMPRNPPHDCAIELVAEALRCRLPAEFRVRIQSAMTTSDSEPEPDLMVVRGAIRAHGDHHPGPLDTALLIEVADASLPRDREEKARLYARAGIVRYWIVNLVDRQVEVHHEPSAGDAEPSYRVCEKFAVGDSVPLVIDGCELARIPVSELLP